MAESQTGTPLENEEFMSMVFGGSYDCVNRIDMAFKVNNLLTLTADHKSIMHRLLINEVLTAAMNLALMQREGRDLSCLLDLDAEKVDEFLAKLTAEMGGKCVVHKVK